MSALARVEPGFVALQSINSDPTRTRQIRLAFRREIDARFARLNRDIYESIVTRDCFGFDPTVIRMANAPTAYKAFAYERDETKITAFVDWLRAEEKAGILQVVPDPHMRASGPYGTSQMPWTNPYIDSAYQRGIRNAREDAIRAKIPGATPVESVPGGLRALFGGPIHSERVANIYTRTFEDLKTVMEAGNAEARREVAERMSGFLARAVADGKSPKQVSRALAKDVLGRMDKVGRARARMIAHNEIIRANHVAQMAEYEALGIDEIELRVGWTLGQNPCPICVDIASRGPYKLSDVPSIPVHPHCVCGTRIFLAEDAPAKGQYVRERGFGAAKKAPARRVARVVDDAPSSPPQAAPQTPTKTTTGAGTQMVKSWHGKQYTITTLPSGAFEYEGKTYPSLTAVAKQITGAKSISGPAFFKTAVRGGTGPKPPPPQPKPPPLPQKLGVEIVKQWHGTEYRVTQLSASEFVYQGKTYPSLTAVAKQITGAKSISGPAFFKTATAQRAVVATKAVAPKPAPVAKQDKPKAGVATTKPMTAKEFLRAVEVEVKKGAGVETDDARVSALVKKADQLLAEGMRRLAKTDTGYNESLAQALRDIRIGYKGVVKAPPKARAIIEDILKELTDTTRALRGSTQSSDNTTTATRLAAHRLMKEVTPSTKLKLEYWAAEPSDVKKIEAWTEFINNTVVSKEFNREKVYIKVEDSGRAHAGLGEGAIYLFRDDFRGGSVFVHEFGHHLEFRSDAIARATRKFYERRTAGETEIPMSELRPRHGYGPDEKTRPDKFRDPYIGKQYNRRSTEVISMGLEYMYEDPVAFARADPDMFEFIFRAIKNDL